MRQTSLRQSRSKKSQLRSAWARSLALSCIAGPALCLFDSGSVVFGQDAAAPAYRTKDIDATLCNDAKVKEKNDKLKPESFDIAGIEAYYQNCVFARLAQPSAESMNKALG